MLSVHVPRAVARALYTAVTAAAAGMLLAGTTLAGTARASTLPVTYDFATAFAVTVTSPTTPPRGANNFSCKPTAGHPYPVILVHGTVENMDDNWQAASPLLANNGYCVFAFNYGGSSADADFQGTGSIAASAQQLASFVSTVLAATGASKVDLVGHSQGGMMPRYYINFLGGAAYVNALAALAPSNYGTTLDGLTTLFSDVGASSPISSCESCAEQAQGSSFLDNLNVTPTVPGVRYTVIETKDDEVVTPYTNAFLPTASNVTNITLQRQCALDATDHLEIAYDPIALADVLNALDPAHPVRVPCLVVLPLTGPVGLVPPQLVVAHSQVEHEPGRERPRDADHHVAVGCLLLRCQDRIPVVGSAREDGRFAGAADPLLAVAHHPGNPRPHRVEDGYAGGHLDRES
jgi:triacylglycerol esterase/lipase EstA (alpha/beta hydrolase family)